MLKSLPLPLLQKLLHNLFQGPTLPAPRLVSAFSQAWKEGAQPCCLTQLSKELGDTRLVRQWRAEHAEPELLAQVLH